MADSILASALCYAAGGHRVVPLRGKRPTTQRGACEGTTNPETIRRWFTGTDFNVGLCLDRLLVVDIDPRNGGDASWQRLVDGHGAPDTLIQRTGSGGEHYVFPAVDTEVQGKPAEGIDVLTGPHRYIVAAPSRHPLTGRRYEWRENRAPSPIPPWLLDIIARPAPSPVAPPRTLAHDDGVLYERARRYLARCEPAISGQGGHNHTFRVALKLATNFGQLGNEALLALLTEWNAQCVPPWSMAELQHKLDGALRTVSKRGIR